MCYLISIIYQTNAMESNTPWIRLFHIVFVTVSLTTGTGERVLFYLIVLTLTRTFI